MIGFSPDGQTIVVWRQSSWRLEGPAVGTPYGKGTYTASDTGEIGWAPASQPERLRWCKVPDFFPRATWAEATFSPDSTRIAVASRVIRFDDGSLQLLGLADPAEQIVSLVGWLSASEVTYAAIAFDGSGPARREHLRVYRQRLDQPAGNRREVFHVTSAEGRQLRRPHNASNGRYMVIDSLPEHPAQLVDVLAGTSSDFGPVDSYGVQDVAWNQDCSRVFCCLLPNLARGALQGEHFVLMDTVRGQVLATHTEPSGPSGLAVGGREMSWTPDQQVLAATARGYYLIRPIPWSATPIDSRTTSACGWPSGRLDRIRPTPVGGCYLVTAMELPTVATSIDWNRCVVLSTDRNIDHEGVANAVSPDGKLFAEIKRSGNVLIWPISLVAPGQPTTQNDQRATTQPANCRPGTTSASAHPTAPARPCAA
jgi:hypothetical protein